MFSNILVPVEFSARCEGAARYAEALANHFHAKLTLLHVVMPAIAYGSPEVLAYLSAADLVEQRTKLAKAHLATFVESIPAHRVVEEGDAAQQIVEYAGANHVELIVLPTHGYGPFRRFLLGSVTAKVLHDAACAVWTGPHLEQAPSFEKVSFQRILCAVDLSESSRALVHHAAAFAREFGAVLHLVHALPASRVDLGGSNADPEWRTLLSQNACVQLTELLKEAGVPGQPLIEIGDAGPAVREAAGKVRADLVVVGRGHHASVLGRLRTHSYGIIRESPCPVLAV